MRNEPTPADRRRVGELAVLWMELALGSVLFLTGLLAAFLVRKGRRIRASQPPPRPVPDEFLGDDHDAKPA